jgi:hypothetical protein
MEAADFGKAPMARRLATGGAGHLPSEFTLNWTERVQTNLEDFR